jgi:hypothetical protein
MVRRKSTRKNTKRSSYIDDEDDESFEEEEEASYSSEDDANEETEESEKEVVRSNPKKTSSRGRGKRGSSTSSRGRGRGAKSKVATATTATHNSRKSKSDENKKDVVNSLLQLQNPVDKTVDAKSVESNTIVQEEKKTTPSSVSFPLKKRFMVANIKVPTETGDIAMKTVVSPSFTSATSFQATPFNPAVSTPVTTPVITPVTTPLMTLKQAVKEEKVFELKAAITMTATEINKKKTTEETEIQVEKEKKPRGRPGRKPAAAKVITKKTITLEEKGEEKKTTEEKQKSKRGRKKRVDSTLSTTSSVKEVSSLSDPLASPRMTARQQMIYLQKLTKTDSEGSDDEEETSSEEDSTESSTEESTTRTALQRGRGRGRGRGRPPTRVRGRGRPRTVEPSSSEEEESSSESEEQKKDKSTERRIIRRRRKRTRSDEAEEEEEETKKSKSSATEEEEQKQTQTTHKRRRIKHEKSEESETSVKTTTNTNDSEKPWVKCGQVYVKCRGQSIGLVNVLHRGVFNLFIGHTVDIVKRLPVEKLQIVAPYLLEIICFEANSPQEKEELAKVYKTLDEENMVGVVQFNDRMLLFIPPKSKLMEMYGIPLSDTKMIGAILEGEDLSSDSTMNIKIEKKAPSTPSTPRSASLQTSMVLPPASPKVSIPSQTLSQYAATSSHESSNLFPSPIPTNSFTSHSNFAQPAVPSNSTLASGIQSNMGLFPQKAMYMDQGQIGVNDEKGGFEPSPPSGPPPLTSHTTPVLSGMNIPLSNRPIHAQERSFLPSEVPYPSTISSGVRSASSGGMTSWQESPPPPPPPPPLPRQPLLSGDNLSKPIIDIQAGQTLVRQSPPPPPISEYDKRKRDLYTYSRSPSPKRGRTTEAYGNLYTNSRSASRSPSLSRGSDLQNPLHPRSTSRSPDNRSWSSPISHYISDSFSPSKFGVQNSNPVSPNPTSPFKDFGFTSNELFRKKSSYNKARGPYYHKDKKLSIGRMPYGKYDNSKREEYRRALLAKPHPNDLAEPSRFLWVGRFYDMDIGYNTLRSDFEAFGPLESINLLRNQKCAFVNFKESKDAEAAKKHLEGTEKYQKIVFTQQQQSKPTIKHGKYRQEQMTQDNSIFSGNNVSRSDESGVSGNNWNTSTPSSIVPGLK